VILWKSRNEFYVAVEIILLYVCFESRSFRAVPYDREAGVRGLLHYLGKSPDGNVNTLPVEQATGIEKSRWP
jgi:hypothetical protein